MVKGVFNKNINHLKRTVYKMSINVFVFLDQKRLNKKGRMKAKNEENKLSINALEKP